MVQRQEYGSSTQTGKTFFRLHSLGMIIDNKSIREQNYQPIMIISESSAQDFFIY